MKAEIHPDYVESTISCSTCGSVVHTHATVPEIRVDLCSNCHPYYTGKQRIVDTAGRVDRFNQRRAAGEKAQKAATRKASASTRKKKETAPATAETAAPETASAEATTVEA